jgi:RNA recognition motif-containing protein
MLHELFKRFGPIKSCKVSMYKKHNVGKHGFVHFTRKEDGDEALTEMNGK